MAEEEKIKDTQSNPLPPFENIYFLSVCVLGATDLEKADISGSSDPYCKVIANTQSWKTKTIRKNVNPKWNEETQFIYFDAIDEIRFEIYDEDKNSKNDKLGFVTLATKDLYNDSGYEGSLNLKKCKKGAKIQVRVNGRLVKPLDLEQSCKKLESEVGAQEGEINRKKQAISDLMMQNGKYAQQKNELIQKKQDLDQELANVKQEINDYKDANNKKQLKIKGLKEKKQNWGNKINQKQAEYEQKQAECVKEQARVKDIENQYQSLQKELNEKREQYNNY